jgi:hypothetical protein
MLKKNDESNSLMTHSHDGAEVSQRSDVVEGCNSFRCHESEVSYCQMLLRTDSTIIHYCGK